MRRHFTARNGWIAVLGVAGIFEALALDGELLSHGIDRALITHPWLTRGVIVVTTMHLLNMIPPRVDPFSVVGSHVKVQIVKIFPGKAQAYPVN